MTEQPTGLLQEIEEDLQRQRFEALWKRYGKGIMAVAALIVLATAGWTSWTSWQTRTSQEATGALRALTHDETAKPDAAMAAYKEFADTHPGTGPAALARLTAAADAQKAGKTAEAVTLYDALASDTTADTDLRHFADLMAVEAQMDGGDASALQKRLEPLLTDGTWGPHAREASAFLSYKAGDKAKALAMFKALAEDKSLLPSQTMRASDMVRMLDEGR